MYLEKDIIKEGNNILRNKSVNVKLPLSSDDLELITNLYQYVVVSEMPDLVAQYKIRPGVGIAVPQVGVNKRIFAVNFNDFLDDDKKYSYVFINPQITYRSKDLVYLPGGEGCLSVDRATNNLVTPRSYKITIKSHIYDFATKKVKFVTLNLEGYPAIVIQHEYDHLDGILFVDKLFKESEINAEPLFTYAED